MPESLSRCLGPRSLRCEQAALPVNPGHPLKEQKRPGLSDREAQPIFQNFLIKTTSREFCLFALVRPSKIHLPDTAVCVFVTFTHACAQLCTPTGPDVRVSAPQGCRPGSQVRRSVSACLHSFPSLLMRLCRVLRALQSILYGASRVARPHPKKSILARSGGSLNRLARVSQVSPGEPGSSPGKAPRWAQGMGACIPLGFPNAYASEDPC